MNGRSSTQHNIIDSLLPILVNTPQHYNNQQQHAYTQHNPTQNNLTQPTTLFTYQHPSPVRVSNRRQQPPHNVGTYATPSPVRVSNRRQQQDSNTALQQQLELEASDSYITMLQQQLQTAHSEVSRLQTECNTKDGTISSLVDEKSKLEEQLFEAESWARSSAAHNATLPTGDTTQHHHCLHYNPQTETVLDISNLGEEIIRQYVRRCQITYTYCGNGGLSNLHTHTNNVRLSLQANIDVSKPKSKCILCDRKKEYPLNIFLEMCIDCYKTQVTKRLTYEEIFAKEIMHAMSDFKDREFLPLSTTYYVANMYRFTEEANLMGFVI